MSDLQISANYLKDLTGSAGFSKDKVGLVNYVVDRLDQMLKRRSDKCRHHQDVVPAEEEVGPLRKGVTDVSEDSAPGEKDDIVSYVPKKESASTLGKAAMQLKLKPELKLVDSRDTFMADNRGKFEEDQQKLPKEKSLTGVKRSKQTTVTESTNTEAEKVKSRKELRLDNNKMEKIKNRKLVRKTLSISTSAVLLALIDGNNDKNVKGIIRLYQKEDTCKANTKTLTAFLTRRQPLQETYFYLSGNRAPHELNKKDMAHAIVQNIKDRTPLHCSKCQEDYVPAEQKKHSNPNSMMKCFNCEAVAHAQCLEVEKPRIDQARGLVWFCDHCLHEPNLVKKSRLRHMSPKIDLVCNNIIGKILTELPLNDFAARSTVQSYSLAITGNANAKLIEKKDKIMLERAFRGLSNRHKETIPEKAKVPGTKSDLAKNIVAMIEIEFPLFCSTCRSLGLATPVKLKIPPQM